MDHFNRKNGVLHAEDVAIPAIAAEVGTPFMSIRPRRWSGMPRC